MRLHAEQDVREVVDRVHLIRLARRDERVEAQVLAGVVVPDEEEVLPLMQSST
jgi:hypothetical protein